MSFRRDTATLHSLLLSSSSGILLLFTRDDLPEHHDTVAVHEGDTRETLAVFEAVTNQWLLRLECTLCHLVGFQSMRVLHFLASGFFAHLPNNLRDSACRPSAAHESDRRVAALDLIRDVKNLDLCFELLCLPQGGVFLLNHDIA